MTATNVPTLCEYKGKTWLLVRIKTSFHGVKTAYLRSPTDTAFGFWCRFEGVSNIRPRAAAPALVPGTTPYDNQAPVVRQSPRQAYTYNQIEEFDNTPGEDRAEPDSGADYAPAPAAKVGAPSALTTTVKTDRLHWHAPSKTFSIEASAIGWPVGRFAASVTVISHKTGAERQFIFSNTMVDDTPEAEVQGWFYNCGDLHLIIVND